MTQASHGAKSLTQAATLRTELAPALDSKPERLMSLDVFRGLTIAGMILVNNPGSWGALYSPLEHAPWDGWTPTDFIFPFFLFIVGVAMTFSFDKRLARGLEKRQLLGQVFCRSGVLFLLGLILGGFPNLRLITPFILGIVGLEWTFAEPPRSLKAQPFFTPKAVRGLTVLGIALLWFLVDFRYFNGPTQRSGFQHIFPLSANGEGSPIRLPGVLQRIALCYGAAALIMVITKWRGRLAWALGLIVAYWVIMKCMHAPAGYVIGNGVKSAHMDAQPGAPFPGALNDWIDVKLLGGHLYSARPDPEGLLSTIPAIATTLFGILTGMWIQSPGERKQKAVTLLGAGVVMLVIGAIMGYFFPINKKIWSSSYVVFMAGWALTILSACYYVIDVAGYKKWALPFLVLGMNAIVAFFGSGLMARLLTMIKWGQGESAMTLKGWLYAFYTSGITAPKNASLVWALSYVLLWVLLLTPLYRKRIFLKV